MLKASSYLKNPNLILLGLIKKHAKLFPDKFYVKIFFRLETGKKLNLKNPQTFNEKLQWLKLYDRRAEYTQMVDKSLSKKYVAKIIGEEYIIPTLGIWNTFDEIDFNALPHQFVLKTTHDQGGVVICKDKNDFNVNAAKEKLINHLGRGFYYKTREWPYKNVTPRILAEKYLVDESGIDLKDYKFFCFDGQVKFIQVDFDRFTNHKRNFYNTSWEFQDLEVKYPNNKNYIIDKPKMLKTMIQMASELSRDIPHLRVDFYSIKDTFFFGELTFFHGNGTEEFYPSVWNSVFGSFIKLTPKI